MSRPVAWVLASLILAACNFSPGGGAGPSDDADVDAPVADADIDAPVIDAPTDAAIDGPTDAGTDACVNVCVEETGVIESCGAPVETCLAGCTDVDSPSGTGVHCKQLVPSNGVAAADVAGAGLDLVLDANSVYTFNTESGEIRRFPNPPTGGGTVIRAAGAGLDATTQIRFRLTAPSGTVPGLAVWGLQRLVVPATTIVRPIAPNGGRAPVIVAGLDLDIDGRIDVGAGRAQNSAGAASATTPGPGGFRGSPASGMAAGGCAPGGPGFAGDGSETGGGGGGLGTAGGKGGPQDGNSDQGGSAVAMGMLATACPQTNLVPLRGGSGGGVGGGDNNADGGGGGGAIQLTAFGTVDLAGAVVFAGGAGGLGGNGESGGGGGGSGGSILVEAARITIAGGFLTATGGGGGGGMGGAPGANAGDDGTVAQGGGNGGDGATGAAQGELAAETGTGNVDGTGGGGGGAGIIHLRAIMAPTINGGAVVRPSAGTSAAVSQ